MAVGFSGANAAVGSPETGHFGHRGRLRAFGFVIRLLTSRAEHKLQSPRAKTQAGLGGSGAP